MQQIQITRGKLEIRANHKALLNGELFLDYTHGSSISADRPHRRNNQLHLPQLHVLLKMSIRWRLDGSNRQVCCLVG